MANSKNRKMAESQRTKRVAESQGIESVADKIARGSRESGRKPEYRGNGWKPKDRVADSQRTKGMAKSQGRLQREASKMAKSKNGGKPGNRTKSVREASRLAEATIGNDQAEWVI